MHLTVTRVVALSVESEIETHTAVSFGFTNTTCGVSADMTRPRGMAAARTCTIFFRGLQGRQREWDDQL